MHRIFRMRSESRRRTHRYLYSRRLVNHPLPRNGRPLSAARARRAPENWFVAVRPGNSILPHGAFHYNRGDTPINARGYCVLKCRGMLAPSMARLPPPLPPRSLSVAPARVCAFGIDTGDGGSYRLEGHDRCRGLIGGPKGGKGGRREVAGLSPSEPAMRV